MALPPGFVLEEPKKEATTGLPEGFVLEQPSKNAFTGSVGASTERLKGEMALLASKLGLKDTAEAEQYFKEQEAKAQASYIPTTKGWKEAPGTKIAELAGGSLPYMAAPIAVAGAAALAPEVAIAGIGSAALAGGATSAAQFTGSNLARQVQEGKSLEEASLGKAAAAAVPQAALDIIGFKMLPGVRTIFGKAGLDLTEQAAAEVAKRSVAKIAQDFTLRTGKVMTAEGLTEAGQQVLERMQAGLKIADPQARQEYLDSFVGGAVLGGVISGPGQLVERAISGKGKEQPPEEVQAAAPVAPAAPAIITDENIEPPLPTEAAPTVAPTVPVAPTAPVEAAAPVQTPAPVVQEASVTPVTQAAEAPVVQIPVTTNKAEQDAAMAAMKELPVGGMVEMNGARYRKNEVGGWDVVTPSVSTVEAPAVEEVKTEVPALEAAEKTNVQELAENFAPTETSSVYKTNAEEWKKRYNDMTSGWTVIQEPGQINLLGKSDPESKDYTMHSWKFDPKSGVEKSNAEAKAQMWAELNEIKPKTELKSAAPAAEEVVTETPVVEPVVEEKVLTQAEINKQRQAAKKAEAQRKSRKSNTLLAELTRLGGVAVKDKLDVTGERGAMLTGGYSRVFKKDSKAGLMNHIESGNLDEYLPYDMRLATDPMAFDATPAYEYLADRIRNGEKVLPFEEEERLQAEAYANRPPVIEPTQEEINAELAAATEKEAPLELEGQTPEQIKAEEESRRKALEKEADEAAKARADEAAKEFTLTGSNRDADIAASRGAQDLFFNVAKEESMPVEKKQKRSREETIQEYAGVRRRIRTKTKQVAKYGSDIPLQRQLNKLLEAEQVLKDDIDATKETRDSAEDFLAKAAKEMADEGISREVYDVVQHVFQRFPGVLDGVRLSVRMKKDAIAGSAGQYNPAARIVTLWKGTAGTDKAETVRHELMHTLEQMMPPAAKRAVVNEWARSLEDAMKTNIDPASKTYFDAVVAFNDNPTKETFDAAVKVMPSYDFYQYLNPSEYWAVNAEKMFASKLGTPWNRFVLAVKRMFQGLKSVLGFNNTYASHKAFNDLIENTPERTDQMLMNYFKNSDMKLDFINNIEDYNEKRAKFDRANAPVHPSGSVKDTFMGGYDAAKKIASDMAENPVLPTSNMIGKLDRAVTNARNKNIWYGTGLELADFERYNGQLKTSNGHAVASVALTNAIHSGHIATQVMTQGALEFNAATQMFRAIKNKFSMANVIRAKASLIKKFGEQTANNMIYDFFEAKRTRSITDEYLNREAAYEEALESGENIDDARRDLAAIEKAMGAVNMSDEEVDAFINLDKEYPELRTMMENWTNVNHNMLDMAAFSGIMSKKRAEHLKSIKDYVPWYRIMDDQADPHQQPASSVRGLTNVSKEKKLKGSTRQIDDIVDNMIHNVMMMTRNSMRNYAANRIVMEYGTRNEKGKLKVFPKEGVDDAGVRFNILANGRRVVVQIPDPLIAEAVMGMENIDIPMINALSIMSNFFRRGITTFPAFQIGQLFMDAPMAAWASGVKNPAAVWAGTFSSFIRNIKSDDPIVANLRAYGIGGYQSSARTPEKELKLEIGLLNGSWWDKTLKALDRFGDASDYSQRRSIYKQVLKETGDEMQAVMAANNVIDFLKRGSGKGAQAVTKSVAFMNAYAQSIDVLAKTLAGGGLKGKKRQAAIAQMIKTGMLLTGATLTYCMLVGDDDDYLALDDQTKMRNIIIPGTKLRLPMHTSASFFFKAMPELIYNKIINEGTKNEIDATRLRKALSQAAKDSLLGPNITPTGVRPALEVALNKDFFTGSTVTPRGMERLEAFRQYNASTSELGKVLSKLSGGTLNPIEMDHLVRGMLGTAGAAAMWGTNMLSGDKPTAQAKENPMYGSFILPDIPRGKEDLYYDLKEHADRAYFTFMDLNKKGHREDAKKYYEENADLIRGYGYTSGVETSLKEINAEIRRTADLPSDQMSPDMKRQRMNDLAMTKNRMLDEVIAFRKRAGL